MGQNAFKVCDVPSRGLKGGDVPLIQFKKGEEKGHSLPLISEPAWAAVALEMLK